MKLCAIAHSLDEAAYPSLETLAAAYGWSSRTHRVFDRMFELKSTSILDGLPLEAGLRLSAAKLADSCPALVGHVDQLVYCHALNETTPVGAAKLEAIARDVFHSESEVLSVSHGSCASAILAMHLLAGQDLRVPLNIVILTGEKCFFDILNYADNNGLFGETTSAAWLRFGDIGAGGAEASLATVTATVGGVFGGVFMPLAKAGKEELAAYDRAYMPTILGAAERVIAQAGLQPSDIGLVLPTHLSPHTFNRIAGRLGIPDGRVLKQNLHKIGHCFCGDLFINLKTWAESCGPVEHPVHVLSFAAGMTGSYAAVILTRESAS